MPRVVSVAFPVWSAAEALGSECPSLPSKEREIHEGRPVSFDGLGLLTYSDKRYRALLARCAERQGLGVKSQR